MINNIYLLFYYLDLIKYLTFYVISSIQNILCDIAARLYCSIDSRTYLSSILPGVVIFLLYRKIQKLFLLILIDSSYFLVIKVIKVIKIKSEKKFFFSSILDYFYMKAHALVAYICYIQYISYPACTS